MRSVAVAVAAAALLAGCQLLAPAYPEVPFDTSASGLAPLPANAAAPRITADDAVARSQAAIGIQVAPAGVGRRLQPAQRRTVWVVVFAANRDERPCGPAPAPGEQPGRCVTAYAGAVVDDQSGAIDHTFEVGRQVLP